MKRGETTRCDLVTTAALNASEREHTRTNTQPIQPDSEMRSNSRDWGTKQ